GDANGIFRRDRTRSHIMKRRRILARPFRTILNLVRLDDRIAPAGGLGLLAHGLGAAAVHLHNPHFENPHFEMSVSSVDMQTNAPATSLASVAGDTVAAAPMVATLTIVVCHG